MAIDADGVLSLSGMLRLRLTEAEAARLAVDMSAVLEYVGLLDELDVEDVDPMGAGVNEYAGLRGDEPRGSLSLADLAAMGGGQFNIQASAFDVQGVFSET